MKLSHWLDAAGMTDAEFARVSGIKHRSLVGKYRRGLQFPSPENLFKIRSATAGNVTANDFLDHHIEVANTADGIAA